MSRTCDACYIECQGTRRVGNDDVCDTCFESYLCCDLDDLFVILGYVLPNLDVDAVKVAA